MSVRYALPLLLALAACAQNHPAAAPTATAAATQPAKAENTCLPPSYDISRVTRIDVAPKRLAEYRSVYRDPWVTTLRERLDQYVSGTLPKNDAGEETARALAPYGRAIASDPFYVMDSSGAVMGGETITLRFVHHTDALYHAWLYQLAPLNGVRWIALRAFDKAPCTAAEQRYIAQEWKPIFALGDDSTLMPHAR